MQIICPLAVTLSSSFYFLFEFFQQVHTFIFVFSLSCCLHFDLLTSFRFYLLSARITLIHYKALMVALGIIATSSRLFLI